MAKMLFEISEPIVWRYLNVSLREALDRLILMLQAANAGVRIGAFFVQVNVYPPVCDDNIRATDYENKHFDAFLKALRDPSIDICLKAIEYVCEVVSIWWTSIPEERIQQVFKVLGELATDETAEIRAALYAVRAHQ
jgi:hypothetical protein